MNAKTMDGLIGARRNIDLVNVPMRVYKEARLKGDTATMERAMGYVGEFSDKAWEYESKADEGMKEEAKEEQEKAKEKAKEALAEKIGERKEERKDEAEALAEKMQENGDEKAEDVLELKDGNTKTDGTGSVKTEVTDKKPVLYTSTGQAKTMPEQGLGTNVSVSL